MKTQEDSPATRLVLVSTNTFWNIFNFRMGLVRALQAAGFTVEAAAADDKYREPIEAAGIRTHVLPLSARGRNPFAELRVVSEYRALLRQLKPFAFLTFTIKPNVWGGIAARGLTRHVANVAGMGALFTMGLPGRTAANTLYRFALRRTATVFFQNPNDEAYFGTNSILRATTNRVLLPGSGVDTKRFVPPSRSFRAPGQRVFLMVARLLGQKGVLLFMEAARLCRQRFPGTRFQILGIPVPDSTDEVPVRTVRDNNDVEYLEAVDDVRPVLENADLVVLPSMYKEGTPRSLIEAAACGRVLIASDVPGCREIVRHNVNGWLCQPASLESLRDTILEAASQDAETLAARGRASRELATTEFDEQIVISRYLQALQANSE